MAGKRAEQVERADAARNRRRVLEAAERLFARHGADRVTMEEIARAAGVGKGTLYRRYPDRAAIAVALLDEHERALQEQLLRGPPPLGPGAPPTDRLIAFGRERIRFAHDHSELLSAANRDPQNRHNAPATVLRTHVRVLLKAAESTGDLDAQTDALLALLDVDYVEHQLAEGGHTLATLGDAWESLARKLCGR
jgi:AcrR family transcriptional regulator